MLYPERSDLKKRSWEKRLQWEAKRKHEESIVQFSFCLLYFCLLLV